MELAKIEQLLEAYFEGNTTLAEEAVLQDFFTTGEVPEQLRPFAPIFASQVIAREEQFTRTIELPVEKTKSTLWKWSIAASVVIALGVGSLLFFQNDGLTAEQEEALMAYNQAKETMLLLSENLNKATSKVTIIDEFAEGTSTINLINQFTESKNKFLK